MGTLLAQIWAFLVSAAMSTSGKIIASLTVQVGLFTADERQILVDAKTQFAADVKAGKSLEEAFADALTVFFNEEKGEVNKAVLYLFKAFGAGFGVPMSGS